MGPRLKMLASRARAFLRAKRGNVAIITALAAIPMCFLAGTGIDYGTAVDRQSQLNAIADAAALAAVTPAMMSQSTTQAQSAAQNTFDAQARLVSDITWNDNNLTVSITTSGAKRTATVSYTTTYNTYFPSLLGKSTIALSGSSSATGGMAPNIDFYLLLDDSPSMAIAATQSGINTMVANTQGQCDSTPYGGTTCGCAFGCHEQAPNSSQERHLVSGSTSWKQGLGNPGGVDNYALARSLGVTLRIDMLNQASQNLMDTAQTTESTKNASYRMAIYTFDYQVTKLQALTASLSTAKSSAANLSLLQVYSNNYLTSSNNNNDEDTDYDNAMNTINSVMPNPGSGTNNAGDTPQEVLFIVTDGVEDECQSPALNAYSGGGCRQQYLMNSNTDWCSKIKNRGIRIAILYTEYLPLPTNGWYNNFQGLGAGIKSFQPNIANQLQTCASPGLFYQVSTGGDISAALQSLFASAVQSAYLSH
jgi:Flp pilus assembly protein TadG